MGHERGLMMRLLKNGDLHHSCLAWHARAPTPQASRQANPTKDKGIITTTTFLSAFALSCPCDMKDWQGVWVRGLSSSWLFGEALLLCFCLPVTAPFLDAHNHHDDAGLHHTQSLSCIPI